MWWFPRYSSFFHGQKNNIDDKIEKLLNTNNPQVFYILEYVFIFCDVYDWF